MADCSAMCGVAIAVHGGAGTVAYGQLASTEKLAYLKGLEHALRAGHKVLLAGDSSVAAVVASVKVLEDSPLFNAGMGSVYTADGHHELDAAIMDGAHRAAGAVAGVMRVRNPIELAQRVMQRSPHVLLIGEGADCFAQEHGVTMVANTFFDTPQRWQSLLTAKERVAALAKGLSAEPLSEQEKHGTVGCVALDRAGNLAAGTSTGGMTNKSPGRVGDSPLIGSGTFADNATCAVSATGHGEFFIRYVVAHEIASLTRYAGKTLAEAADDVVYRQLPVVRGTGGVIAIDRRGQIAMPFNTSGMYRGSIDVAGQIETAIYRRTA